MKDISCAREINLCFRLEIVLDSMKLALLTEKSRGLGSSVLYNLSTNQGFLHPVTRGNQFCDCTLACALGAAKYGDRTDGHRSTIAFTYRSKVLDIYSIHKYLSFKLQKYAFSSTLFSI